jgi:hypothetical protein
MNNEQQEQNDEEIVLEYLGAELESQMPDCIKDFRTEYFKERGIIQ